MGSYLPITPAYSKLVLTPSFVSSVRILRIFSVYPSYPLSVSSVMDRWVGKVALVTGASVGIGAAICEMLVKHGVKVVGCAKRVHLIDELSQRLSGPGSLTGIKCDLTKTEEIDAMFDKIKSMQGKMDICINNAGYSGGT